MQYSLSNRNAHLDMGGVDMHYSLSIRNAHLDMCGVGMQEMMERERGTASSSLARERARANAAEQAADSSSSQAEARKRQLQHDLDNAHSEVRCLHQTVMTSDGSIVDISCFFSLRCLPRASCADSGLVPQWPLYCMASSKQGVPV